MSSLNTSQDIETSAAKTVRVVIKGMVHGVFYRNWTVDNAKELGSGGTALWRPCFQEGRRRSRTWSSVAGEGHRLRWSVVFRSSPVLMILGPRLSVNPLFDQMDSTET